MSTYLSLGQGEAWQSLSAMSPGNLYWLISDTNKDIDEASLQIIRALSPDSSTAFIGFGWRPDQWLSELKNAHIRLMPLLYLPNSKAALINLTSDIDRSNLSHYSYFIVHIPSPDIWEKYNSGQFEEWLQATKEWLKKRHITLLILQHHQEPDLFSGMLGNIYYTIGGVSRLYRRMTQLQWQIAWWRTPVTLLRNQTYDIDISQSHWTIKNNSKEIPLTEAQNDELLFLVARPVLAGAPPLTHKWQLYDDNESLVQNGKHYQAATCIFALTEIDRIEILARQIHSLRSHCGRRIKIIVREIVGSSRFSDTQLLLLCGANLIVPHELPYSKFLLLIESVRGQYYTRPVPRDIHYLLKTIRPIPEKGVVSSKHFVERVLKRMQNELLLANEKGVLVILKPKPGLTPEQVLTTCHIAREGDIITIIKERVYLFLSTCGIGDNQIVIQSLFKVPFDVLCENWDFFHQDNDVSKQLTSLPTNNSLPAQTSLQTQTGDAPHRQEHTDYLYTPYSPTPINLLADDKEGKLS